MKVLFYGIAIVVAFVLPGVAVAFYFGIAEFLVVPFRAMGTVLSRREPGSDGS